MYAERSKDARAFHEAFPQRAGGGARYTEHARDPASTGRTPLTGIRSSDAPRVNTAHATHEPHVTRNGGPHTYSMGYCDASSCWGSAAQVHAAWLLLLLSCHTEVLRHTNSAAMPLCRQLQVGGALLPFAKAAPHPVYHHLVVHACKHHWRGRCQGRCGKCGPFCLTHDVRVLSGARERDSCVRICSGANTDDAFDACDGRGAPPARAAHPCTCPKAPRLVH